MNTEHRIPRLAVTCGEPAGIGPDIVLDMAGRDWPAEVVVLGNRRLLASRASSLAPGVELADWDPATPRMPSRRGRLLVADEPLGAEVVAGQLDARNAPHVLRLLERACDGCLAGDFDAMLTAPVQKAVINEAGIPFTGHTEFLAQRCGIEHPVMMLATSGLRVALLTTHLPLRAVADQVQAPLLRTTIDILHRDLQRHFGIPDPVILVLGLNPHAGESGHLGDEEQRVMIPLLDLLKAEGLRLLGPLPADTAFTPTALAGVDAVLAMYHDQGLPVLKARGFGEAVNVTLGLPVIRTSVDHGTALDLAGSGRASPGSLIAAAVQALEMLGARA
ncbi:MAG: 4-hydroxythreonine-4-phosphate dehydrogenase PdxA [Chromatiales bacterium]|nr:4-hydroxythreonine-4-phosphate dehydrogenase PdxA [Chromatiales bacterium]